MTEHTWSVKASHGGTERVTADAWQIGPNGDLAFFNEERGEKPFFVRAFAAGRWTEVWLFA